MNSKRLTILKIAGILIVLGWVGAFSSLIYPQVNVLWFVWVVPLTIITFIIVFFHPFGMQDDELPTQDEMDKIKSKRDNGEPK